MNFTEAIKKSFTERVFTTEEGIFSTEILYNEFYPN